MPGHVSRLFAQLPSEADLSPIRLHDLRHGAATPALVRRGEAESGVGDARALHDRATADTYTSVLAEVASEAVEAAVRCHELRELGLRWAVRDNGLAEPAGIPHRVLRALSRRRVEIEAAMAERGSTSRADALGFDTAARTRLLGRLPARLPEPTDLLCASAELLLPAGLTAGASTFSRPDAIRGWCVRLPQGAAVAEVEALVDRLLVCPDVVGRSRGRRGAASGARGGPGCGTRGGGQRGVVTAVDPDRGTLTVRIAGHEVSPDAGYLRNGGLDHGYALTVHQAQGLTCQSAMLLGSDALHREAGYVGLSRGRERNDLHLVERAAPDNPEHEPCHAPRRTDDDVDAALTAVRDALRRSRAQSLAHDLGR